MPVLDNDSTTDRLPGAAISSVGIDHRLPLAAPVNDHLDALEAQSIYILREAFARLKKLALLWSLGKDSNVMIWLARKAFFGRVPFPAMHVDTGKKFPEMYAFRDRYGKEWDLDLRVEPCPPIDAVDPTLPPAARSAARKTEGLKLALNKYGFDGLIAGILGPVQRLAAAGRASAHSPDPALDRGRHLGLHQAREHPHHPALSRQRWQALSLARRPGHHQSGRVDRLQH
jgi:hypothetical protein